MVPMLDPNNAREFEDDPNTATYVWESDDRDAEPRDRRQLVVFRGGNGDFYVGTKHPDERAPAHTVRVCLSGGTAIANPRLARAVVELYWSMFYHRHGSPGASTRAFLDVLATTTKTLPYLEIGDMPESLRQAKAFQDTEPYWKERANIAEQSILRVYASLMEKFDDAQKRGDRDTAGLLAGLITELFRDP